MKNLNLIKRLWTDSHEKQTPQRFGRYAVMLIMFLTLGVGQMWAGTSTTVYYAVPSATWSSLEASYGTCHIVVHVNYKGDGDEWGDAATMVKSDKIYNGKILFSASFTDKYNGLGAMYFKVKDGSDTERNNDKVFGNKEWTSPSTYNGKIKEYNTSGWQYYGEDRSIYVHNDVSWAAVKLYTYNPQRNGDWNTSSGGVTDQNDGWYKVDIVGAEYFILHSSEDGNSNQTVNKQYNTVTSGRSYHLVNGSDGKKDLAEEQLTVTVNMHGHDESYSSYAGSYYYNELLTEVTEPSASGYIFGGWFKESTYDNEWDFANDHVTSDVTLHAKWTLDVSSYTVTYDVGTSYTSYGSVSAYDNTEKADVAASPATVGAGNSITFTADPEDYYETEGWYSDAACSAVNRLQSGGDTYTVADLDDNISVYVKFKLIDYTITYKDQGDVAYSGNNSASLTPTSYNYGTGVDSFVAGTKTGYTFGGWYDNASCIGEAVTSISSTDSGDKTLYAKWTPKNYAITYVDANSVATLTSNPANGNTDATISFTATLKPGYKDLTITAVDGGSSSVTVNLSDGSYNFTMPANTVTVTISATPLPIVYVLKTPSVSSTLSDFESAGSDTDIKIWAWERVSGDNKNFYDKNYDNRYDAGTKGTPTYTDGEKGDTWYRFIPDYNLSYFDNTKAYSVIITSGSTKVYASNDDYHYVDAEKITSNTNFTGTVWIVPHGTSAHTAKLYTYYPDGVWRVKYDMKGHGDPIASENVTANVPMSAPTAPTASGYAFAGWYTDSDCTSKWSFSSNVTSDMTLYAKWVAVKDITVYIYNSSACASDMDGGDLKIDATPYIGEEAQSAVSNQAMTADGLWYKYTFDDISGLQDLHLHWANSGTTDAALRSHAEFNDDVYIYQASNTGTTYIIDGTNNVSVSSGANGSVSPSGTLKVPVENDADFGVSLTATPSSGYTFAGWVLTGNVEIIDGTVGSTTIQIISTGTGGTVTANFRASSLQVFVEGRLSVRTTPNGNRNKSVGGSSGAWSTTSTDVEMVWNSSTALYELRTYCTMAELTGSNQYIRVGESNDGSTIATCYQVHNESDFELNDVNNSVTMSTSYDKSAYFNNSSNKRGYIVLTYSSVTKKLGFRYEDSKAKIDDVSLSPSTAVPGETVTATPSLSIYPSAAQVAYCWKLYSDAGCTSEVATDFTSIGDGEVNFAAPMTEGTYYLKLTILDGTACAASIADTHVETLTVNTTNCIFFRNVPAWTNVYVYSLGNSEYWNSVTGSGCNRSGADAKAMTRIGKSYVYYYRFDSAKGRYVAFADKDETGNDKFDQCQVAYREDYNSCAPMYVPENWITEYLNYHDNDKYRTAYYSSNNNNKKRGYWTTYPRGAAGFSLKVYSASSGNTQIGEYSFTQTGSNSNTYEAEVSMSSSNTTYYYNLYGCAATDEDYSIFGCNTTMTVDDCANKYFYTQCARCGITTTAAGMYKFKLLLSDDGSIQVTVDYPLAVGDYRLVYSDDDHDPHPTRFIRGRANGKDTISVWVNKDGGSPILKVQKCTSVSPIEWTNYTWGTSLASTIDISELSAGVYNFYLEQNGSKHIDVKTDKTTPYTGLYYIRTEGVDGGWMGYNTQADNRMTYSYYAEQSSNCDFNYYKTKWINDAGSDVTFTIACDYSESLCDTLMSDAFVADATNLPQAANIRFGWDSKTNTLSRAYISGSSYILDRFLVMIGDDKMLNTNGLPLTGDNRAHDSNTPPNYLENYEMNFTDLNNWIYRADIQAKPGAAVKLTADYNDDIQYFIGSKSTTETIIGGSGTEPRLMRVTYDFKTNRLMTAWLPDGNTIGEDITLKADMMLIRKGQEAATQITFATGKQITDIKSIYGVLQFDYSKMVGRFPSWSSDSAYAYLMYYISFPFDVKVSEIFGVGTRGENWIVQKYNGAKRAKIGWFAETSTFWETLPGDSTLHANEGYLLILDRKSFNDGSDAIWYKQGAGDAIYLYFPSASNTIGTINAATTQTITVPSHLCEIDRPFTPSGGGDPVSHKNTDSHWNVIGTPLFASANATTVVPHEGEEGRADLNYYYAWDCLTNTLSVDAFDTDVNFKSMHAYMVQYTGDVTFTGAHIVTPALAPRRASSTNNYRLSLQLVNENDMASRTYVELRENACDTFLLNEDVYMMRTSNTADLYSFAGAYDVAANVLPIDDQLVKVGVDVKQAGTYRFTMPSEFSGTVTLIDTETGIRTSLSLNDYEVALPKGISNTRFLLEIDIHHMPTAIDGVGGSLKDGKAHKFIQNGQMYILQNGKIYDAQGRKMK